MFKKTIQFSLMAVLMVALTACSNAGTTAAGRTTGNNQTKESSGTPSTSSSSTVQSMLAVGTLELEGTDQAVTADQAKELLPLWKAVRVLGSSDTISQAEKQALYDQIQETMTADQIQAISKMSLTREDMTSIMAKLGVDTNSSSTTGLTEEERAAQIAAASSSSSGSSNSGFSGRQFNGGDAPGGRIQSGNFPGGMPSGEFPGEAPEMMPGAQGTPSAGQAAGQSQNMTSVFLDPLIKMLKERAGS